MTPIPCRDCGGSGWLPYPLNVATGGNDFQGTPCPRCADMPKLLKSYYPTPTMGWTETEMVQFEEADGRGWFKPDPGTVAWLCEEDDTLRANGDRHWYPPGGRTQPKGDIIEHTEGCGWVTRPERLETVER